MKLASLLSLTVSVAIYATLSEAQTPVDQATNTAYTFSSDDIYNSMTPAEQQKFDQMQDDLRKLQSQGRSYPEGDVRRDAALIYFEQKKRERDEAFGYLRGINGVTVNLWGTPTPDPSAIISIVVMERRTGAGDGMLWPHWYKDREGALIGSETPPRGNKADQDAYPAGPTVNAGKYPILPSREPLPTVEGDQKGCLYGIPDGGVCN